MSDYKAADWRMRGYYPEQYAKSLAALGVGIDYSDDDFDRYEAEFLADLAAHDAKVRAEQRETDVQIAEKVRQEHVNALVGQAYTFDSRWEQGAAAASDRIARAIRAVPANTNTEEGK